MPIRISSLCPAKRAKYRDAAQELLRAGLIPSIPKELETSSAIDIAIAPRYENILWQLSNGSICCAIFARLLSRRGGSILQDFAISSDCVSTLIPLSTEGRSSYRLRHGFDFAWDEVLNHRIENGLRFHRRGDLAQGWLLAAGITPIPDQYPDRMLVTLNVTFIDQFGDSHRARAEALMERTSHKKDRGLPPREFSGVEPQPPEQEVRAD